jgi:hypothetical protein
MVNAAGPYRIPHVKVDGYSVLTNQIYASANRGFGAPQPCFAYESQMDELAHRLGIDHLAIRKMNYLEKGEALATGQVLEHEVAVSRTAEQALAALGEKSPGKGRVKMGRGYVPAERNKEENQPIGTIPMDAIFSFSLMPLYIGLSMGGLLLCLALLEMIYVLSFWVTGHTSNLAPGWSSLMFVILIVSGILMVLLGFIGIFRQPGGAGAVSTRSMASSILPCSKS